MLRLHGSCRKEMLWVWNNSTHIDEGKHGPLCKGISLFVNFERRSVLKTYNQIFFTFQKLHTLSLGFIKATALLFYRRIFCVGRKRDLFDVSTMVLFVVVMLWTAVFFILDVFVCGTHVDAAWTGVKSYLKYCHIATAFEEGVAISDFLLDLIILLVPIPKVRLQDRLK